MFDGMLYNGEQIKINPFARTALICSHESLLEFFRLYDGSQLEGIYCINLATERVKKIKTIDEGINFYLEGQS